MAEMVGRVSAPKFSPRELFSPATPNIESGREWLTSLKDKRLTTDGHFVHRHSLLCAVKDGRQIYRSPELDPLASLPFLPVRVDPDPSVHPGCHGCSLRLDLGCLDLRHASLDGGPYPIAAGDARPLPTVVRPPAFRRPRSRSSKPHQALRPPGAPLRTRARPWAGTGRLPLDLQFGGTPSP